MTSLITLILVLYLGIIFFFYFFLRKEKNSRLFLRNISFEGGSSNDQNLITNLYHTELDTAITTNHIKTSLFNILYYSVIFFIFVNILSVIFVSFYLSKNNILYESIEVGNELFDEQIYNTMAKVLNPLLQISVYLICFIGIFIASKNMIRSDFLRFNKSMIHMILIGIGLIFLVNIFSNVLLTFLGLSDESKNEQSITEMLFYNKTSFIITAITTIVLAPVVEELVFRKSIFNLCGNNTALGFITSSIIFGGLHVIASSTTALSELIQGVGTYDAFIKEVFYIIPYSLMGACIGYVYVKSKRNIAATILCHALNNTISLVLSVISYIALTN